MVVVLGGLAACGPATLEIPDGSDAGPTLPTGGPVPTGSGDPTGPEGTTEAPDFRVPGPHEVVSDEGSANVSCSMRFTTFRPADGEPEALVVLAHGFERSRAQMAGHAEHFASWGLAVVTPDLCTADFWNIDHERNAQDLVALAGAVAGDAPVVYAGHSAGGLASFLAAATDAGAVGQLGLDLVDWEALALSGAPDVDVPAFALLGEPSFCNSDGNAEPVYAAVPGAAALRVAGADHCDFENPTDWMCTSVCGGGSGVDAAVAGTIEGLATAALLWTTGLDPLAEQWWTPGTTPWDALGDAISVP